MLILPFATYPQNAFNNHSTKFHIHKKSRHLKRLILRSHLKPSPIAKSAHKPTPWMHQDLKHVLESQQFDIHSLNTIFNVAKAMESVTKNTPESEVYSNLIYILI